MDPVAREARTQDADFLAWTILTAARAHLPRGWYDIAIGLPEPDVREVLRRLVLAQTPSWWRFDNFLVAEIGGHLAGGLCGFDSKTGWGGSEAAMAEAVGPLGWGEAEWAALWGRGAYIAACPLVDQGEAWVIENVATTPEFRGLGVAGHLLEAACAVGARQGFGTAQLSFIIGNAPAERAYAKAGFRFCAEARHPDFEAAVGAPGLRRLARAL